MRTDFAMRKLFALFRYWYFTSAEDATFAFVCVSVYEQDNSKSRRWTLMNFLEEWDV